MANTMYSCVLAEKPKFAVQALVWAWSLIDLARVSPSQIVVHALPDSCQRTRRSLEELGTAVIEIEPFHTDHPYCNKLVQLDSPVLQRADRCLLCDSDIAFTQPVEQFISSTATRAKIVDLPNPPLESWQRIIEASGLPEPSTMLTSFGNAETPSVNCNGGLYMLPAAHFKRLCKAWPEWANWLIKNNALLDKKHRKHIDQISFGLACIELNHPIEHLSITENYPTHSFVDPKPDVTPSVIHYHSHVDPGHLLKPIGQPRVDRQIERVNNLIRQRRRQASNNIPFWDYRYSAHPDLGFGTDSLGESLALKRVSLSRLNDELSPSGVLDIGCGDLEVTQHDHPI